MGARIIGLAVIALLTAGLTITAPANAAVGDSPTDLKAEPNGQSGIPTLSWDWMRDARSYNVQISTNGDFSGTLLDNVTTTNVDYTPTTRWPAGTIWWRVSAKYADGTSGFSQESFNQDPSPTPTLSRPENGTTLTAPEQPPVFDWEPVGGAISYDVQVSDDPQFGRVLSTTNSKTTTLTLPSKLPARGTYYWRVQANFPNAVVSGFPDPATAWSYTIASHAGTNALPVAPAMDSAQTTPVMQDVALAWPTVPGATTYTLMVSTDQDFKESSSLVANVPNLRGTRYSPPVTWRNDDYYWRVQGFDASGNALGWWPTSGGWKFQRNWPDDVVQEWPADGATITDPARLYLQWKPIRHASSYKIVTSSSPTMADAKVCSTTNTTFTPHWTSSSNQARCVPTPGTKFYWQVIGYDDSSSAREAPSTEPMRSQTRSFTYEPATAPGGLTGPVPVEAEIRGALTGTAAASGSSASTCDATLTTACQNLPGTPTLSWPAVPGADGYAVWVSHDQSLSNLYPSDDVITTQGSTWTLPSELADSQANQSYWIAVKACTSHVDCTKTFVGSASAKFNVLSQSVHPCRVTAQHDGLPDNNPVCGPEAPASTTLTTNDNVTFDWSDYLDTTRDAGGGSVSGGPGVEARYYQIQTSTSPDFTTTIDDAKVDQTTFTSANHTYPDGPIYWRVRAWDGSSNPLRWSPVAGFDKRSEAPTPTAPVSASVGTAPQLEWTPEDNTKSYNVEVYKDDRTEFGPANRVQAANTVQTKWTFTTPLSPGDYLWRVQRVDADGRLGPWSGTRKTAASFTVHTNDFDAALPDDNSTLYPTTYSFSWGAQADAVKYRFEKQPPSGASTESATTAALSWSPKSFPANNTSWRWRVVPVDTAGHDLTPSPWRSFDFVSAPTATTLAVDGQPQVGSTLKAITPSWSLGDVTTTFQWYYGSVSPSNAIPVQNNAPELFTPRATDVGKSVVVVATGRKDGFTDGTVTSTAYKITLGPAPQLAQSLVLEGSGAVDTVLAGTPVWTDPNVTTEYQWLRDGKTIYGQTTNTYQVQAADFGHTLSLQVTGSLPGMTNGVFVSAPTAVLAGASLVPTSSPYLSGSASAGSYLYVNRGSWTNNPTSFAYQWLRDGTPIAGQTASSYQVVVADIGHRVAALVTASRSGYQDGTAKATSATVPRVVSRTSASLNSYSVTRRAHAKVLVTVTAPPIRNATGRLRAYVGKKVVRSVLLSTSNHGKKTISLPRLGKGRHTVRVRYLGNHLTRPSISYKLTLTVTR